LADQEAAVLKKFKKLLDDDNVDFSTLEVDAARIHREATSLVKRVTDLRAMLDDLDVDSFIAEEDLWLGLEDLIKLLRKKLSEADRRSI
jgi:hypothetical protein